MIKILQVVFLLGGAGIAKYFKLSVSQDYIVREIFYSNGMPSKYDMVYRRGTRELLRCGWEPYEYAILDEVLESDTWKVPGQYVAYEKDISEVLGASDTNERLIVEGRGRPLVLPELGEPGSAKNSILDHYFLYFEDPLLERYLGDCQDAWRLGFRYLASDDLAPDGPHLWLKEHTMGDPPRTNGSFLLNKIISLKEIEVVADFFQAHLELLEQHRE